MSDGTNDLMTRQFTTLTRLCTLRHLDLQLIGVSQIMRRNTETARSNLLDSRSHSIAILHSLATLRILTTFTGIRLATKTIHSNGQSRVRFHRDGTIRHSTRNKATHNLRPRLDLINGDRSALIKVELKHTTQGTVLDSLMFGLRVSLVRLVILTADCILHIGNANGVIDVCLATITPMILAGFRKTRNLNDIARGVSAFVESKGILSNQVEGDTADTAGSTGEAAVDDTVIDT